MSEERTTINVLLCKAGERAEMVEIGDSLESFQEVVCLVTPTRSSASSLKAIPIKLLP